jgi:hypothetical protein
MTVTVRSHAPALSRLAFALVRAGLLTALVDGVYACVLSVGFYQSTATRLWQGVASTLIGPDAFSGGIRTAAIGVLMHVGVAFGWSAVFLLLFRGLPWIRSVRASRWGAVRIAVIYGPLIWMVMSLGVIPMLTGRPPVIGIRWWTQLVGHVPFVGLPIVLPFAAGQEPLMPPGPAARGA